MRDFKIYIHKITISWRIISFLVVLFVSCGDPDETEPTIIDPVIGSRPNILWLVAEDLGPYIPSFGDSTIDTPNLNRLASEGVRYTNVYSPSGVCSPSRAALATGLYPARIGAHNMQIGNVPREMMNDPRVTQFLRRYMPEGLDPYEVVPPPYVKMHSEFLREEGYYCTNNFKEDYQFKPSPTSWDESSRTAHWRNREKDQPFFAIFNFMVTHESQIWAKGKDSLWVEQDLDVPIPPYLPQTKTARQSVRRMYSNILEMDSQVGKLLDQLEQDGELENTIIFWYTDHGGPLPRQKRLLYDSGIEVPMIIRFPQKQFAGEIDDQLISFVDFLPTLLSIVDIKPPDYLDGRAFLGNYKSSVQRQYIHAAADRFDEHRDMIRAVRDKRFKYLRNLYPDRGYYLPLSFREQMPIMKEMLRLRDRGKLDEIQSQWFRESKPKEELFDCLNDPHELNNLADDPRYREKLDELKAECDRWMDEIEDKGFIEEAELVNQFWPNGEQPKTQDPRIILENGKITISTNMDGSALGYQVLDEGDSITGRWQIYLEPVEIGPTQKLYVVAHRKGYLPSGIVVFEQ